MGIAKGSYVLATKYNDGDPGDAWAVGYYVEQTPDGRHRVGDENGKLFYGPNGFRRARPNLRVDVGKWLVENNAVLECSPPGSINLWTMLTDSAFEDTDERATGTGKIR